ncbi:MAG: bifunctional homocysteine S-methyltransferase/methylenetetrahydrofolate reductase [Acidobacteria bacterium]|nr:bifunctional homocysteine S-methyltransferase/methylenetetrahydrofolate reductase [Acidobacteriota bacterium]
MAKRRFPEVLEEQVLLCDGAMGTYLHSKGIPLEARDEINLTNPELIRKIHEEYIAAGAKIIETNTFTSNRVRLRQYGLEDKLDAINRAAVRVAREAVGDREVFVAGSVGPLGILVKPYGKLTIEDLGHIYAEQIEILVDAGVDLLLIESHPSLLETLEAYNNARSVCQLPIITSMTFLADGKTVFGDELAVSLDALGSAGADVVGINCTIGPKETYDVVSDYIGKTHGKVAVQPNAGYPTLVGGRNVWLSSPEYLREYARMFVERGAAIVGGCCGTTPEHIRAMNEVVHDQRPRWKRAVGTVVVQPPAQPESRPRAQVSTRFTQKLGKEFVTTVEIDPPKGLDYSRMIQGAEMLKQSGADAATIGDNPMARVRMSAVALAHLVQEETGLETVLHFTCRDRNIIGIQSELLGAAALGIHVVLALTGDPAAVGDYPKATTVYDVNSTGLVRIMRGLNQGKDLAGQDLGLPTHFTIGVAVNPAAEDLDRELARFEEKIDAGADFAQTQPLYDQRHVERFVSRAQGYRIPILIGLLPLRSSRHALFLHNEVPGILIPEEILKRIGAYESSVDQMKVGIDIAREFLSQVRPMVSGVDIMPPFDRFDLVLELLETANGEK